MPCAWTPCAELDATRHACADAVRPLWLAAVHPANPALDRACAGCGTAEPQNGRAYAADALLAVVDASMEAQGLALGDDPVLETMGNLCASGIALHEQAARGGEATLCLCQTCSTWLLQRSGHARSLLPLQALQWYLRTTSPIPGLRHVDTRVLYKLACAVAERHFWHTNVYRDSFYPEEQALLDRIAAAPPAQLKPLVAAHFLRQNGGSLFVPSGKVAEFLREHLPHMQSQTEGGGEGRGGREGGE